MSAKECIVKSDVKCQGWIPNDHCYTTILYNKKRDMSCLYELVEKCSHSGAINLPKTIINMLKHGVDSGYGESHFASIFLQLIREQLQVIFGRADLCHRYFPVVQLFIELNVIDNFEKITLKYTRCISTCHFYSSRLFSK